MSGRRSGDRLAWIVVGETLLVRFAELEGLISIREDKDVHGSCTQYPTTKKTLNLGRHPLRSRSSRVFAIVKELQFDFGIQFGREQGKKPDVASQYWDQKFSTRRGSTQLENV